MTFYVENETEERFPFSVEDTVRAVCEAVLEEEGCPYEVQVNVVLTDNSGIRELNRESRGIDRETDVLSFPNVDFEEEGVFDIDEEKEADYFDPDTGELILGDIMISVDRVKEQAESYGHSTKREFAFLVAHSMLHLCGYDHMEEGEAAVMEKKQEDILAGLGITREGTGEEG
jgi:probable rRNA maturation factor